MSPLPDTLRDVLDAARRTAFYGPEVPVFPDTPVITLETFYADRTAFEDPDGNSAPEDFEYPLQPAPDVTVLVTRFRERPGIRVISSIPEEEFHRLTQDAIAAPVGVLRQVAPLRPRLRYPLVVFTGPRHGALSLDERVLLEDAFAVPLFEQLLGPSGELLAAECTAHQGLHVRPDAAYFETVGGHLIVTPLRRRRHVVLRLATGISGRITATPCRCGRSGIRLVDLAPSQYQK